MLLDLLALLLLLLLLLLLVVVLLLALLVLQLPLLAAADWPQLLQLQQHAPLQHQPHVLFLVTKLNAKNSLSCCVDVPGHNK
jgi:hypothetical protein